MARYECVRLSSDIANKSRIIKFENALNQNLVDYLQENAWDDDTTSANAVYVVLDRNFDSEIVMYFALKSGMFSSPFSADIYEILDKLDQDVWDEMPANKVEALKYLKSFIEAAETNSEVNKVADTKPGVELSQFCINLAYRKKMQDLGINTKGIGAYIFHSEIYPIVQLVKEYVGCQFLYLFAADSSDNGTLIKYYRDMLGFSTLDDYDRKLTDDKEVIPIMPYYDYQCKFMFMPLC